MAANPAFIFVSRHDVKIKNYPEKFREFPGLSPRNLSKIPEGKSKIQDLLG